VKDPPEFLKRDSSCAVVLLLLLAHPVITTTIFHVHPPTMATLILNLVKRGIKAEPSAEALYELLQLADPNLKYSGMRLVTSRDKLFKQLKAAVHPDKHVAANYADANAVFQQLTNFYDGCATFDFSSK
jgi:hypothetical protein